MKVDCFVDFSKNLQRFSNNSNEVIRGIMIEILFRTLNLTIDTTPVGVYPNKQGGTLKKSWSIGNISIKGNEVHGEITNTAPYAPYVEFGHRIVTRDGTTIGWHDGKFMLTVSLQTVERHLDEIAGVEIERAFGRAFK